jgi:hypothetical protein
MKNTKIKSLLFFIVISLLTITVGVATFLKSYQVGAVGRIVGVRVEIYEDAGASMPLTQIDWKMVEPDETKTYVCYVKSLSNVPTTLSLMTSAWMPSNASTFITLTWNYDNTTLLPNEIRQIVFSLHVSPIVNGIDNFSFEIIVSAEKTGFGV